MKKDTRLGCDQGWFFREIQRGHWALFLGGVLNWYARPLIICRVVQKPKKNLRKSRKNPHKFVLSERLNKSSYSTLRAKTGKMEEPVNRELNVTRS